MCNLQNLTFTCGHTHLTLISTCASTFRRTSTLATSPPEFCHEGTRITKEVTANRPCAANCRRKDVLDAITRCYKDAKEKLDEVSQRVEKVEASLVRATERGGVKMNFGKLALKGWDAGILECICPESLGETKRLVSEYGVVREGVRRELEDTFAVAKGSVKEEQLVMVDGTKVGIVSFDASAVEEAGEALRAKLHDCVCEVERRASEACLEKLGWEHPVEDGVQCAVLKELGGWKRGFVSGTRLDNAFVGRDELGFVMASC